MAAKPQSTTPRRISIAQAAARLGTSERYIRNQISHGALPAYRVGAKIIRVDPSDVDKLEQRIPTVERGA